MIPQNIAMSIHITSAETSITIGMLDLLNNVRVPSSDFSIMRKSARISIPRASNKSKAGEKKRPDTAMMPPRR